MISGWRDLLLDAVTPLESGVGKLRVYGFNPTDDRSFRPSRTAAVLVPLLDLDEPQLVLTRRAEHLLHHPGQVSFPGGAAEEGDETAVKTALREANEEIGLPLDAVRPVGFLDRLDTISDYRVLPVVGLVTPPVQWKLDETEVAEVFTVPLSVVLDETRYEAESWFSDGRERKLYSLYWNGYRIWGATAAMLLNLIMRMKRADERKTAAEC